MKDKIVAYFSRISPLTSEEMEAIKSSSVIKEYRKGAELLRIGQLSRSTYFVLKGLVRQYHLSEGKEKTTAFFVEDDWVISLTDVENPQPSPYSWVCEEDCTVLVGDDTSANALFAKFPRLESIARRVLETTFLDYQRKVAAYFTETPEQRYLRLQESNSSLLQRIPQYQLASYIGVKPESLSRIRKRLADKKPPSTT